MRRGLMRHTMSVVGINPRPQLELPKSGRQLHSVFAECQTAESIWCESIEWNMIHFVGTAHGS